ncbi:hypothetical protein BJX68DRAFT_269899 [Aspergillus pseudodeflectus]|uniref:Uncharacterized protein n=1 Tax=Aspergillus pseudodeflectus TaxID=176178 RepID=A0ABR4JYN3_9EURO
MTILQGRKILNILLSILLPLLTQIATSTSFLTIPVAIMRGGKFHKKVILAEHDGLTIQRPVLPETEQEYKDVLPIFDQFVEDHPGTVTPPDIQTFKAFMEYISVESWGKGVTHSITWARN